MPASLWAIAATIALVAFPGWVRAHEGPLLSDLLIPGYQLRSTIPESLSSVFKEFVSDDQQVVEAASNLISAARVEVEVITNRYARAVREHGQGEQALADRQIAESATRAVERRLRDDLRSLAPTDDPAASPAFERAWRRQLLRGMQLGLPFEPRRILRQHGVDPLLDPYASIIDQYEREFDRIGCAHAVSVRRMYAANEAAQKSPSESSRTESIEATQAHVDHWVTFTEFMRLQTLRMIDAFPEPASRQILELTATRLKKWYLSGSLLTLPALEEVKALDLDPAQRQAVEQIERDAHRRIDDASLSATRAFLRTPTQKYDQQNSHTWVNPFTQVIEVAKNVRLRAGADALALLTPKQRDAYDRAPVRDGPYVIDVADPDR